MYQQILEEIYHCYPMYHKIGQKAYKEGMENIEYLVKIFGNPERNFKTVHVAGSNGKGSVSHLLASFFQEAGYRTGLFTSPHLIDFRERIKVNGNEISEEEVIDFFESHRTKMQEISPSFFEMTVALAFDYFRKKEVDIAIIEVGLGGRLDSTNFITPELSVITNISLEHTAMLGNSISEIAFEKAGIIKDGIPVVIGEYHEESFPVFSKIASEKRAPICTTKEINVNLLQNKKLETLYQPIDIYYKNNLIGENIHCPLLGTYQLKNISTFTRAALYLCKKFNISTKCIISGIEKVIQNVHFQGRWQILNQQPMTICDVGHNLACFQEITTQIQELNYAHTHFIIGFVNDKDIDSILYILPRQHTTYYICQADIERALNITQLHDLMKKAELDTITGSSVHDVYQLALKNAKPEDLIFISGSTFVVGELLKNM